MKRKQQHILVAQNELLVDLTLHAVPADLMKEFALRIVHPYYAGNLNEALKDLIRNALADEELLQTRIKTG